MTWSGSPVHSNHPTLPSLKPPHTETTAQKFYPRNKNILKQCNIVFVIKNIRSAVKTLCYFCVKTVSLCCFYVTNTDLYAIMPFGRAQSAAWRTVKTLTAKQPLWLNISCYNTKLDVSDWPYCLTDKLENKIFYPFKEKAVSNLKTQFVPRRKLCIGYKNR